MTNTHPLLSAAVKTAVVLLLLVVPALSPAAAPEMGKRVAVDGAWLRPRGELADAFDPSTGGLGAGPGYEVGIRFRLPVSHTIRLSPGFHFADFEDQVVTDLAENEYTTGAYSYRFTLEIMWIPDCGGGTVRPFAALGGGLYRDRVVGHWGDPGGEVRNDSSNTFGYRLRLGATTDDFEVGLVAHRNEVNTLHFFPTRSPARYRWNNIGVQVSYLLPW